CDWTAPVLPRRAAGLRLRSLCSYAEDDGRVEIGLTPDEPAGDVCAPARLDDGVEAFARRGRNGHEHGVGCEPSEDPADLLERADDGDGLDTPAAKLGVIVDESDHALAGGLAEL